jgi:outer membrane lipoprotein-sorting protein
MKQSFSPTFVGLSLAVSCAGLAILAATAGTQPTTQSAQAVSLVNRMNSAYRSLRSYYDVTTIKRTVGKKETTATLTLAMQKPNKYLLELKGEGLNTVIVSDGTSLVALRPDRKAYTKTRAPQQIISTDLIGSVDMPSPGARIISQLLAANAREGEIGKRLLSATVTGPQPIGGKQVYVLTVPFGEDTEVRLQVTSDDYIVRQVRLLKAGKVEWTEDHNEIHLDKTLGADTFAKSLPEGAQVVADLPPLQKTGESAEDKGGSGGGDGRVKAGGTPAVQPAAALALFKSSGCARCHNGGGGPDLSHEGSDATRTVQWIADHIRNPKTHTPGSSMPAYGSRMSAANIQTLATYLASLK